MLKEFLCGNTIKLSWVNSTVTPTSLVAAVYAGYGSETMVDSAAMVESGTGNGFFYYLHTIPNTPGIYAAETTAVILGKTYKNRERFKAVLEDVN